jgi:hypothetical protein
VVLSGLVTFKEMPSKQAQGALRAKKTTPMEFGNGDEDPVHSQSPPPPPPPPPPVLLPPQP